jgi:hypothetical protein
MLCAFGVRHRYDPNAFTNDFLSFLTTPGPQNNDPYKEVAQPRSTPSLPLGNPASCLLPPSLLTPLPLGQVALRRWFEQYSRGLPPSQCAADQRDVRGMSVWWRLAVRCDVAVL